MENIEAYLIQLDRLIEEYSLIGQAHYILTDKILQRLEEVAGTCGKNGIQVDINGNDAASVSDGVASVIPASLANQAYLDGIPVHVRQDLGKAYLLSNCEADNLSAFFAKVTQKVKKDPVIDGLPDVPIGQAIARTLSLIP